MKILILFIIAVTISVLIIVSCEKDNSTVIPVTSSSQNINVKYEVTGSTTLASIITIQNEQGGTSQFSNVSLPWEYSFTVPKDTWVYISAQNGNDYGSITVKIYSDSKVFRTSTSQGAYVIASAHGNIF